MKLIKSSIFNAISFQAFRNSGGISKDGANVDVASVWNRRRQLFSHGSNTTFPFQKNAILPRTVNDHGVKPENSGSANLFGRWTLFEGFLNPTSPPSPPPAYLCQHEVVDKRVPVFSCVEGRTKRFCPREVIPGQGRRLVASAFHCAIGTPTRWCIGLCARPLSFRFTHVRYLPPLSIPCDSFAKESWKSNVKHESSSALDDLEMSIKYL